MAYQEFTGELDKPGTYTEFTGQLDAPASQSPGLIASAIDSLGNGMNAVRDWATSSAPESVLQGKVMPEPKFNAAEAERLSTRAYAEGRMNPAAPSMRQGGGIDPASTSTSRGAYLADTIMPVRAVAKAVSGAAQGAGGLMRAAGDVFGSSSLSAAGAATSKGANEFDHAMGDVGSIDGFGPKSSAPYLANMAEGAASSLGQSAAYASMFGARAVIPLMSIMTAGDEYDKARNAGLDPSMALAGAIPKGAFEAIGEKFTGLDKVAGAMGTLLHKGATDQAKREAGQALVRSGIKEIPGEVITYLGQTGVDLLPGIGLKQDLTMSQFIDGLRDTVVQAGMMGGAMGATGRHVSANAPAPLKSAEVMARERGFLTHQNFSAPDSPASLAGITPVVLPVATPAALDAPAAQAGQLPATATSNPAMQGVISAADQNAMLAQALADAGISGESAVPGTPTLENKPIPEAQPSTQSPQTSAVQPTFNQQPETLMMGRSGKGYATQADAKVALQVGQQRQEDLGWKIEVIDGGRFRVAGYTTEPVAAPAPVATGPAAQEFAQSQGSNQAPVRVEQAQEAIKTVAQEKSLNLKMLPLATREIDAAHLGKNGTPLNEGGKPFKTKDEASAARQLQPMLRVVKSPTGKGFSLAPKTEAQLAAQDKAAKRLSLARTGRAGVPTAAHEFLAGEGGMDASTRTEFSFGANPRVGNRTLFAGARGGMSIEAATEKLIEARYLPAGSSHSDTVALINRSFTQPQYTVDGTEVMAEAAHATRFEDHLAAQQEAAQNDNFDPFAPLTDDDFLENVGYKQATPEVQAEFRALISLAEGQGIDAESINMDVATRIGSAATDQEYHDAAITALQAAIEGSAGNGSPVSGSQSQEARNTAEQEGLTAPSRAEILAQQERTDNAQALDDRAQIDAEASRQTLTRQSAPEQRTDTSGDMFAVEKAQAVIDKRNAGVEQAKDPNQAGMFDEPAQEDADELSQPIDQLRKIARDDDHPGAQEARSELARHGLGYGHGNSDHLIIGSIKPPSEEWMQVQNFRRRGVYELAASDLKRFLKLAKARSLDAFEGQAISDRDSTISKWLAESKPTEPANQATAILDAANVTGKERIDVLKDVKQGAITPEELEAAYPAKEREAKESAESAPIRIGDQLKPKDGFTYTVADVDGNIVDAERVIESGGGVTRKAGISMSAVDAIEARKAAQPADAAHAQDLTYTAASKIDTPAQGELSNAKEQKERAFEWLKNLRSQVNDGRSDLRLEIIKAESAHKDALRRVSNAQDQIEKDANKQGLTTIKPKQAEQGVAMFSRRESSVLSKDGKFKGWPKFNAWTRQEYGDVVSLLPDAYRNDAHRREPVAAKDWDALAAAVLPELEAINNAAGEGAFRLDPLGNITGDVRRYDSSVFASELVDIANRHDLGIFLTGLRTSSMAPLAEMGFTPEMGLGAILARATGSTAPVMPMASGTVNNTAYGTMMSYRPRGFAAPMFSKAESGASQQPTRGTPVPRVQAVVDAITAKWANAPEVVVVSDMQDAKVLQKVREADQLQKSQGAEGEPDGFIYKGTVYLVASELPTINDAIRVLFHEALGHSGLRGVFGDTLKPILSQVAAMRRADIVKKAREYGLLSPSTPRDASVNEQWQAMSEKNRQVAAEEVLAVMAQTQPELGFVKRAVSAIRNWLRANVPGFKSLEMTDADIIQAFILPARRHIEGKQASSTVKNTSLEAIAQRESNLLDLIACLG